MPSTNLWHTAAMERQKLVYIMNRDAAANLTISSPLEAHKSHTLTTHIIGVDVGYDNPIFAALETDYQEADEDPTPAGVDKVEKVMYGFRSSVPYQLPY